MNRDELLTDLLTKGVSEIFPNAEFVKKLLETKAPVTVYLGFDPTSPQLHLGHAIGLRKLRQFQDLGHQVTLLIGDFTATIGDPDKLSVRKPLTRREVLTNLATYKKQASQYLRFTGKNKATVKFNSKWLGKLKFPDILSLASHMTVEQLLKRDMFENRTKEGRPIYLHEFMYPLMQGYDSVAMGIDGEIGGTDQMFNMLAGRTLVKQIKGKEKFVITLKLLEDSTGKKMGKTEGNAVSLTDAPEDMYGKVMSWPDGIVPVALELCTDLSMKEVQEVLQTIPHPKDQKQKLAFEIVKAAYNKEKATKAAEHFSQLFQKGELPDSLPEYKVQAITLEEFLIEKNFVASKSQVTRLAEQGALEEMTTHKKLSTQEIKETLRVGTYRVGKAKYFRII